MRNLYLEVAESILIDDAAAAVRRLRELKDLGVHTVMDDFGAAYSSLSSLRRFPLSLLQIGRSLMARLDEEPGDAAIVAAMIDLALGWEVTAHGDETVDQLALLRELVGGLAQSLYFSRPVTGGEASALPDAVSLL